MARMRSVLLKTKTDVDGNIRYVLNYRDQFGNRKRPTFATKKEAELVKRDLLAEFAQESGHKVRAIQQTIVEACLEYDDTCSRGKASRKNERAYLAELVDYFCGVLKLKYVHQIKSLHVDKLQAHLAKKKAASTCNRQFNTYRHFFKKCVRWGALQVNPAEGLPSLAESAIKRKVWTVEQAIKLLETLPSFYGDFLFAMAQGGFRNNEVRKLTWKDVDFEKGVLPAVTKKGGGHERLRFVPMTEALREFLIWHRERCFAEGRARPEDNVFVNRAGNPVSNIGLNKAVNKAREELGYEKGLTPIGLRHFLVTEMQEENQALEKIKGVVGHSAASKVTSDYTHLGIRSLRAAMEATTQAKLLKRGR